MSNLFDFTGKKYIVTGASSGIGRSTAILLSQQGAQVVLIARDKERLEETRSAMKGDNHQIISADLGEMEDMTELFNTMVADGKKLDGLVHCAGMSYVMPLNRLKRNNMEECMRINFYAFLELTRLYAKKKYGNKGSIVAVSSLAATRPEKCQTLYAASKGALNSAVQSLAIELAAKEIRVNSIMPGFVNTKMMEMEEEIFPNEKLKESMERQLLGITEPEEIARVILFLLSEASGVITGRALCADGGWL